MKRKKALLLISLCLTALLLGACGKKQTAPEKQQSGHTLGSSVTTLKDYDELKSGDQYIGRKMGWSCNVVSQTKQDGYVYLLTEISTTDGAVVNRKVYGYVRFTEKQLATMTTDKIGAGMILKAQGTYEGIMKVNGKSYPCITGNDQSKLIW